MLPDHIIEKYRNDAEGLAKYFSAEYFNTHERTFPINPFHVLIDLGIHFVFRDSTQADTQVAPIMISLDAERLNALLDYCSEPRSRDEMQEFCGIKTREYFRKKILVPMIKAGKVKLTIPDKPSSPKQKYVRA